MYYYWGECGGTDSIDTYLYKSEYTILNDNAYVYVSVASIDYDTNSLYKGIYRGSKTTNAKLIGTLSEQKLADFKINNSNYQEFKIYRFVFKKGNNNNYYFEKVEEL